MTKQNSKQVKAYAALLNAALAGQFGAIVQAYYARAVLYHTKQKTVFPRNRKSINDATLLDPAAAQEWIEARQVSSIPPGDATGQKFFDRMMIERSGK
jgi:hypothetical protein